MIKIILKNFRKFEKREFSFDKRLTLISGKSGKGKTTIFMSIIFALTGDGKKIITYGKTSCTVKLIITDCNRELSIIRTKRPNRVTIDIFEYSTGHRKCYEDNEAQTIIDDLFPQYQLGYMSQRVDNKSFILMSPMDKMRFIQKVAFGNENVDTLNKNCRDLIKERKDNMMLITRQRETTEKMLDELNIKKITMDDTGPNSIDESQLEQKITQLNENIHKKKRLLDKTISLLKIKDDLKLQLDKIPIVDENIDEIEEQIKNIHLQNQKWENYQREKKKLDKLEKPSDFKQEDLKIMISDMKKMIELQKQIKDIDSFKTKLNTLNRQIQEMSIPMICPECDNKLELWCDNNGVAVLTKRKSLKIKPAIDGVRRDAVTYEKAKEIEECKYKLQIQIEEFEQKQLQLSFLKEEYPDLDDPKHQLDTLYKIWRNDEEYEKQMIICEKNTPPTLRTGPERSSQGPSVDYNVTIQNKLLQDLKQKQKFKYSRTEKKSNYESIKIDHDIDSIQTELEEIQNEFVKAKDAQMFLKSQKYWNKVETLIKHEESLNKSYPRAVKLQNIIKKAEKLAIQETIDQINFYAQLYLDYFLENIFVYLAFDKDGTKLNVNVTQNNFESDLNNLSGGELARVILAFTIALAEMNNVKLLLLDECVSSLDQETTTNVIETVQNNFNGTIICIAHQTTTGIFDQVVEL